MTSLLFTRELPHNHLETPLHHALVRLSAVLALALVAVWGMHARGVAAFPIPSLLRLNLGQVDSDYGQVAWETDSLV